eukprot:scpid51308/ scgid18086/ Sulfotransferase 1C2A; Sulfotransferase K2
MAERSSSDSSLALSESDPTSPCTDASVSPTAGLEQEWLPNYNMYDGKNFPPLVRPENLDSLKRCKTRSDDVFVCTYSKSGTTWMQHIVRLLKNNGQTESDQAIVNVIPFLEEYHVDNIDLWTSPRTMKCHLPHHMVPQPSSMDETASSPKYIYAMRDPRDVAVSLFYHTRAFEKYEFTGDWNDFFHIFLNGKAEYGSWFEHVCGWWQRRHYRNVLVVSYEEMQQDLRQVVCKVASFLNLANVTDSVIDQVVAKSSFSAMRVDKTANYSWDDQYRRPGHVPFFRKGQVGDWTNHFTAEQAREFDAVYRRFAERVGDFPECYCSGAGVATS